MDNFFVTLEEDAHNSLESLKKTDSAHSEEERLDLFKKNFPNSLKLIDPSMDMEEKQDLVYEFAMVYINGRTLDITTNESKIKIEGDTAVIPANSFTVKVGDNIVEENENNLSFTLKYIEGMWLVNDYS